MKLRRIMYWGLASLVAMVIINRHTAPNIDPPVQGSISIAITIWLLAVCGLARANFLNESAPLWASVPGMAGFVVFLEWVSLESHRVGVAFEGTHPSPIIQGLALLITLCHVLTMLAWFAFNIGQRINEKLLLEKAAYDDPFDINEG